MANFHVYLYTSTPVYGVRGGRQANFAPIRIAKNQAVLSSLRNRNLLEPGLEPTTARVVARDFARAVGRSPSGKHPPIRPGRGPMEASNGRR